MTTQRKHSGFTLIELMVTLAIFALVALIGGPVLTDLIRKERLKSQAENMLNYMLTAQELAVSTNRPIAMIPFDKANKDEARSWLDNPIVLTYVPNDTLPKINKFSDASQMIRDAAAQSEYIIAEAVLFPKTAKADLVVGTVIHGPTAYNDQANYVTDFALFMPDTSVITPSFYLGKEGITVDDLTKVILAVGTCESYTNDVNNMAYFGNVGLAKQKGRATAFSQNRGHLNCPKGYTMGLSR